MLGLELIEGVSLALELDTPFESQMPSIWVPEYAHEVEDNAKAVPVGKAKRRGMAADMEALQLMLLAGNSGPLGPTLLDDDVPAASGQKLSTCFDLPLYVINSPKSTGKIQAAERISTIENKGDPHSGPSVPADATDKATQPSAATDKNDPAFPPAPDYRVNSNPSQCLVVEVERSATKWAEKACGAVVGFVGPLWGSTRSTVGLVVEMRVGGELVF
ncbi:hypothetical protein BDK51DRAFT_41411 [Blyttiomyces helicus]|uniref:Uncharacterized protein n=1 Tax=Blyttiomyces helicus TaxID=388810 RepID=A0A4P9WE14_9FUNG|nr:hypothetical protein BDK51DRAFT_41411 [Blyttiomyces helicus]|eukprot:RKO89923.1 hypothetical protein BDK51DRAFT_41411 [Blyttiomyces helicus]